jgi:hypothetical protein
MPRGQSELGLLIADLGKLPAGVRRELRPAMRKAAQPILADAKRRASWSSRIPGAIKLSISFQGGSRTGVRLVTDSQKAPHARPFESGSGRNRNLRHPVFPRSEDRRSWTWVEQTTRPFFFPAVRAGEDEARRQAGLAVLAAARSAGF